MRIKVCHKLQVLQGIMSSKCPICLKLKSFGELTCGRAPCLNEVAIRFRGRHLVTSTAEDLEATPGRQRDVVGNTAEDLEATLPTDTDIGPPQSNFDAGGPSTPRSLKPDDDQTPCGLRTPSWPDTPNSVQAHFEHPSSQGEWEQPCSSEHVPFFQWQAAPQPVIGMTTWAQPVQFMHQVLARQSATRKEMKREPRTRDRLR